MGKLKRDDMSREIESAIKPIKAELEKKVSKLTNWMQGNFFWSDELLSEMIAVRSRAKRALQKVSELKFYDDTDEEDEAFEEVPIDRNESEINYMNDRVFAKPTN